MPYRARYLSGRNGVRSNKLRPAVKQERSLVVMAGLADAAGYAGAGDQSAAKFFTRPAARGIDELVEAERRDAIGHPPPGRIGVQFHPGEHRLEKMHVRGWRAAAASRRDLRGAGLASQSISALEDYDLKAALDQLVRGLRPCVAALRLCL